MNKKNIIIWSTIVLLAATGYFIYYTFFTFHITSISPSASQHSQHTPKIDISFNRPIKEFETLDVRPLDAASDVDINDKTITIYYGELPVDAPVTIKLTGITSTQGDTMNYELTLHPKEIEFDKVPKDQQEALLEVQDRHTEANSDPVFQYVPHANANYAIEAIRTGEEEETNKAIYDIEITVTLSSADVRIDRDGTVKRYTDEAMEYLKGTGLDLSQYTISTTVSEPSLY